MGSIGWGEMIIIFAILLLVFGAKRLPELARGLGKSIREFKKATNEISDEFDVNKTINAPRETPPNTAERPESKEAKEAEETKKSSQSTEKEETKKD